MVSYDPPVDEEDDPPVLLLASAHLLNHVTKTNAIPSCLNRRKLPLNVMFCVLVLLSFVFNYLRHVWFCGVFVL